MTQSTSQYLSSCPLRTERALRLFFSSLSQCSQIRLQDSTLSLEVEHMTLQAPTENVEKAKISPSRMALN